MNCPEHGVVQVQLPWAEPMSRFTILFERLAVDVLKECDVTGAGHLLRTSWDETWHVMERAVARGLRVKEPVARCAWASMRSPPGGARTTSPS